MARNPGGMSGMNFNPPQWTYASPTADEIQKSLDGTGLWERIRNRSVLPGTTEAKRRKAAAEAKWSMTPSAPAATPIQMAPNSGGMSLEDMIGAFSAMSGGGGGGSGGGGVAMGPLRDIDAIRARYGNARTELGTRYGEAQTELDGIYNLANTRIANSTAERGRQYEGRRAEQADVGATLDADLAAAAAQAASAREAHGIGPTSDTIGVSERASRDDAIMRAAQERALESMQAESSAQGTYDAELRDLMDESARTSARQSKTDLEAQLLLQEAAAIEEAEQFNAAQQAAAAAASGGGGAGGFGGMPPEFMAMLAGDELDAIGGWNYPQRDAVLREAAKRFGPDSRELLSMVMNPEGTLAGANEVIPSVAAELNSLLGPSAGERAVAKKAQSRLNRALNRIGLGGRDQQLLPSRFQRGYDDYERMVRDMAQRYYQTDGSVSPQGQTWLLQMMMGG